MKDQIEKQAIEEMENDLRYCHTEFAGDFGDIYTDYHKTAEKLVVIGYRKQSVGEWEIVKGSNGKEKMICTNCRHQQDLASTFTYCPNCGAKMKGGAE